MINIFGYIFCSRLLSTVTQESWGYFLALAPLLTVTSPVQSSHSGCTIIIINLGAVVPKPRPPNSTTYRLFPLTQYKHRFHLQRPIPLPTPLGRIAVCLLLSSRPETTSGRARAGPPAPQRFSFYRTNGLSSLTPPVWLSHHFPLRGARVSLAAGSARETARVRRPHTHGMRTQEEWNDI